MDVRGFLSFRLVCLCSALLAASFGKCYPVAVVPCGDRACFGLCGIVFFLIFLPWLYHKMVLGSDVVGRYLSCDLFGCNAKKYTVFTALESLSFPRERRNKDFIISIFLSLNIQREVVVSFWCPMEIPFSIALNCGVVFLHYRFLYRFQRPASINAVGLLPLYGRPLNLGLLMT